MDKPMDKKEVKPEVKKPELQEVKQARIDTCTKEVNKILDQYGCTVSCYMMVTTQGNIPKIEVISK